MAKKTYIIETDKGSYEVDVDEAEPKSGDPGFMLQGGAGTAMLAGAKGFAKGVIPGAYKAVIETIPALVGELVGTAKGTGRLITDPQGTLSEAWAAVKDIPGKARDTISSAMELASRDPEAFGRAVGEITGATEAGIAGSKAIPLAPKPIARTAGRLMEQVGQKGGWPIRMMGAHQLGSGNPMGIATLAAPEMLKTGGKQLQEWGGADLAKNLPSGAREIEPGQMGAPIRLAPGAPTAAKEGATPLMGTPAEASGRVQKVIAKEEKAAAVAQAKQDKLDIENKKLEKLEAATKGKEMRPGPVRQTTSATTPGGIRMSQTETFANKPKKVVPGTGASEISAETSIEQAARMLGDRRAELSPSALRQGQPTVTAQPSAAETTPAPTPPTNTPVARGSNPEAVGQTMTPYTYRVHPNYVGPSEMLPDEGGPYTALPDLEVMSPDTAPPSAGVKMAPGKLDPATEAMLKKAPGSRSRTSPVSEIGLTPEDEAAFREAKGRGLDDEKAKQIMLFQRAQRSEMYNTGTTDPLAAEAMKQEMGL